MSELPLSDQEVRDRNAFTKAITHDLRGPLRNVTQASELMVQLLDGQSNPPRDKLIGLANIILESGAQCRARIDALRQFHDAVGAPSSDAPLAEVIGEAVRGYLGNDVDIDVRDGNETVVPKALGAVLSTLLDNATKYGSRHIQIHAWVRGDATSIQVLDDGIGFPPHLAETIFDPFFRTPKARTHADGTGMGLAKARELTERLGGRIWAESPGEGNGATFRLSVPLFAAASRIENDPGRPRILIVEDEWMARSVLQRAVSKHGDVDAVGTFDEAAKRLCRFSYDLVFIDQRLDKSNDDGCKLIRALRLRSCRPLVPVVLMSGGYTDVDGEHEARRCGANAWCPKPWRNAELDALTLRLLERPVT